MLNKKNEEGTKHRDLLMVVMGAAIVATNILWYAHVRALNTTDENHASSWLQQQVEINNLKACIDNDTKPCDIDSTIRE